MSENFTVEIISPDDSIIKTQTSEVIIPAFEGELGILKDHIPLITFLRPGIIKISGTTENKFLVEEGTVEFSNNNLLILTPSAKELSTLDKNSLNNIIDEAEKNLIQIKLQIKKSIYYLTR